MNNMKNIILKDDNDFYISFNWVDCTWYGDVTTAIVVREPKQFLILLGDHYDKLKKLKTLQECVDYFFKNISQAAAGSEHGIIRVENDKGKYDWINGGVQPSNGVFERSL